VAFGGLFPSGVKSRRSHPCHAPSSGKERSPTPPRVLAVYSSEEELTSGRRVEDGHLLPFGVGKLPKQLANRLQLF